ncbi:MAG: hypothetical protein KAF41_01740 [Flavobacterium sp.]|uniref:hypothetical protein n=1 Tax=Flavobacterium sp. Leaf359 TaxID=1736351 RepID=UPI0006FFA600|nr:hypothetical protein [Flavobacterium sp. Leaf359]KQS52760.1 hypothetical protein ASG38_16660 [Flavobacterium sp. Leaf359]MBU7569349.1 hypothetical protein [Flavobacterium sp.]PZO27278.1 MAG: hypothetical protein DCE86_13465 [Flavobacteriaceae bacterium]
MKLDKNQIHIIETVLDKLGVVYVDYKYEILDHIATEVEEKMIIHTITFEEAFPEVLKKWQSKFKKSSSVLFGYFWEMPEILLNKCIKMYRKKLLLVFTGAMVLTSGFLLFSSFLRNHLANFFSIATILYSVAFLLSAIGYVKIRLSKRKTSYGFLYKQQFMASVLLTFQQLYFMNSGFERNNFSPLFSYFIIFVFSIYFLLSVYSFIFYKAHFQELKRMQYS